MARKKRLRRLGDIISDLEKLLDELFHEHDLQWGDVLSIFFSFIRVHYPKYREEYLDGTHPTYYFDAEK